MTGIAGFFKKGDVEREDTILAGMLDTLSEGMEQGELVVKREIEPGMGGIGSARWSWIAGNDASVDSGDSGCSLYIQGDMYGSTVGDLLKHYRSKGFGQKYYTHFL